MTDDQAARVKRLTRRLLSFCNEEGATPMDAALALLAAGTAAGRDLLRAPDGRDARRESLLRAVGVVQNELSGVNDAVRANGQLPVAVTAVPRVM
ncbi:MAG: hypothetical protein AB7K63_17315 [Vicinamibacterales bacterium]